MYRQGWNFSYPPNDMSTSHPTLQLFWSIVARDAWTRARISMNGRQNPLWNCPMMNPFPPHRLALPWSFRTTFTLISASLTRALRRRARRIRCIPPPPSDQVALQTPRPRKGNGPPTNRRKRIWMWIWRPGAIRREMMITSVWMRQLGTTKPQLMNPLRVGTAMNKFLELRWRIP